jgi:hypothetical protein
LSDVVAHGNSFRQRPKLLIKRKVNDEDRTNCAGTKG